MKREIQRLCKAPKSRNFDVLYAFSVCRRCAHIWFGTRIINFSLRVMRESFLTEKCSHCICGVRRFKS
jgi:hypothetical protein